MAPPATRRRRTVAPLMQMEQLGTTCCQAMAPPKRPLTEWLDDDLLNVALQYLDAVSLRAAQCSCRAVCAVARPIFAQVDWQSRLPLRLLLHTPEALSAAVVQRAVTEVGVGAVLAQAEESVHAALDDGEYAAAGSLALKVVAARRALGSRLPDTLASMHLASGALQALGRFSEAETMSREGLEASHMVLGPCHPDTLGLMCSLASALLELGRHDEAVAMQRDALVAAREMLGDRHTGTLVLLANLASSLSSVGQYTEAETTAREATAAMSEEFGSVHPATLIASSNLANTLAGVGRYAEAEEILREVAAASSDVQGARHPETLAAMASLGNVLTRTGRAEDAVPLLQAAAEGRRQALGVCAWSLSSVGHLAEAQCRAGRLAEARAALCAVGEADAPSAIRAVLGEQHPRSLELAAQAAWLRVCEGDEAAGTRPDGLRVAGDCGAPASSDREASQDDDRLLLRDVVDCMRRVLGPEHALTRWWAATTAQSQNAACLA